MSLQDMEYAALMNAWQKYAAQREGFSYCDGVSQELAALLAEGERQLEEWNVRDSLLKLRSLQSAR